MSIHVERNKDGGITVSGKLDKDVKIVIPDGYRVLTDEEDVEIGDKAYNCLTNMWVPVTEIQLAMSGFSGSKKEDFRVPPVRQMDGGAG